MNDDGASPTPRPRLHDRVIVAAVTVQAVGLLTWAAAPWAWWADLVGQVPLFWMGWGVLGLVAALALDRRWAVVLGVAVALQGSRVGALWIGPSSTAAGPEVVVLLANVHTANQRHDLLLDLVEREAPDVVGLLETDARWLDALQPLRERYPHHLERIQSPGPVRLRAAVV